MGFSWLRVESSCAVARAIHGDLAIRAVVGSAPTDELGATGWSGSQGHNCALIVGMVAVVSTIDPSGCAGYRSRATARLADVQIVSRRQGVDYRHSSDRGA